MSEDVHGHLGKSINEVVKECVGWLRDAARLMGESEEFIGKGMAKREAIRSNPNFFYGFRNW